MLSTQPTQALLVGHTCLRDFANHIKERQVLLTNGTADPATALPDYLMRLDKLDDNRYISARLRLQGRP